MMNPLEMTYTPPSPKAVSPADVYNRTLVLSNLAVCLNGYKVVGFAPPKTGDTILTSSGLICVVAPNERYGQAPRFILKRERTDTERIDGITKLYFANTHLGSREAIDEMMDREGL